MAPKLIPCTWTDLKVGDLMTWGCQATAHTITKIEDDGCITYDNPAFQVRSGDLYPPGVYGQNRIWANSVSHLAKLVFESETKDRPHDREKIASDGLSTDYYKLPDHATELRHLISHKGMSFARGNVFKACYRLDEKEGVDALYDINKIIFFANEMKEMIERGERV